MPMKINKKITSNTVENLSVLKMLSPIHVKNSLLIVIAYL